MSDRAAQIRTLATSFYRELMRLADEMDAENAVRRFVPRGRCCRSGVLTLSRHHEDHCLHSPDPALDS